MRVLVAGASGAIGVPLVGCLEKAGHSVWKLTRIQADALDFDAVLRVVREARPDAIVNQLTALPRDYSAAAMREGAARDRLVRLTGARHLVAAAREVGVGRFVQQSAGFLYAPGAGLAEEREAFAREASPGVAASAGLYADLEAVAANAPGCVSRYVWLRYGMFYGPGTWWAAGQRLGPVIGDGAGVWSFIHVEDAAGATVRALECPPGAYNVVDDEPVAQREWMPAYARWMGAAAPVWIREEEAAGPDAVYYATRLRGASNARAREELGLRPRRLEWL